MLILAAAAAGLVLTAHHRVERRLRVEWARAQDVASAAGLRLQGRPEPGWSFQLAIANPQLQAPGYAVTMSTDRLVLHEPPLGGPVFLTLPGPASIAAGSIWRVWGQLGATFGDQLVLHGAMLRLAAGGGPDGVATIGRLRAALTREHQALRLTARITEVALPRLARASPTIRRASLELTLADRTLIVQSADLDWEGSSARLQGTLSAGPSGALSGRLALALGSGWREAIARTVADRLISPAQGQAAIGLVSLLAPGSNALPLAVENGRVTLAGLLLAVVPALPSRAR